MINYVAGRIFNLGFLSLKPIAFLDDCQASLASILSMMRYLGDYNATDFLNRLLYLTESKIENIQTDNGSEFAKYFEQACQKYNLDRYYNRPRTPKDNPVNERFNKTVEEEFIQLGNFTTNTLTFNSKLTDWLIEYNFKRPHQTLNYETPIKMTDVSPRYSSSTNYGIILRDVVE